MFETNYELIKAQLDAIDPIDYGRTRNYLDGSVTRLSPYISRGVISTKMVMQHVLDQGHSLFQIEKFLQELAWRDYWQQIWIEKGDLINDDLKQTQPDYEHFEMPRSIIDATTGVQAIDQAINQFYIDGYLHNHVRMYIAAIACNMGKSHWKTPARWMYYHLLDGDWASNALSWQWVAGSNSNKKYWANQDNINKYCYSAQRGTFLDVEYEAFDKMSIPIELSSTSDFVLKTKLQAKEKVVIESNKPLLVYNYYNLDPNWHKELDANRVLLLEPSIFKKYPISPNAIDFMMGLSGNIPGIQIYVGEFQELKKEIEAEEIIFKEHPLNFNYEGIEEPRDWMFSVKGYYPSFFGFWKKCKKELKQLDQ